MLTEDGFFFVTVEDLQYSTTLSKYQQSKAISKLEKLGLIKQQNRGVPPKRYFKLIFDNELLTKYLQSPIEPQKLKNLTFKSQKTEPLKVNSQTPMESQKSKNLTFKSEDTEPLQSPIKPQKLKNLTFKSEKTEPSKVKKLATNNNQYNNKQQQSSFDFDLLKSIDQRSKDQDQSVPELVPVQVQGSGQSEQEQYSTNKVFEKLVEIGINKEIAKPLAKKTTIERIQEIQDAAIKNQVDNLAGYARKAIENDVAHAETENKFNPPQKRKENIDILKKLEKDRLNAPPFEIFKKNLAEVLSILKGSPRIQTGDC